MNVLISNDDFNKLKVKEMVPMRCYQCQKEFYRMKKMVLESMRGIAGRSGKFCSKRCCGDSQVSLIAVECFNCGIKFNKTRSQCREGRRNFCSHSCRAKVTNLEIKKSRRSKAEENLYQILITEFPNLLIIKNDKLCLSGLEIDIFIPSLNLGIEWNGILHYEPIFGLDQLEKIKSRDSRKLEMAKLLGIELIIIPDLTSCKRFASQAYSEIVTTIKYLIENAPDRT